MCVCESVRSLNQTIDVYIIISFAAFQIHLNRIFTVLVFKLECRWKSWLWNYSAYVFIFTLIHSQLLLLLVYIWLNDFFPNLSKAYDLERFQGALKLKKQKESEQKRVLKQGHNYTCIPCNFRIKFYYGKEFYSPPIIFIHPDWNKLLCWRCSLCTEEQFLLVRKEEREPTQRRGKRVKIITQVDDSFGFLMVLFNLKLQIGWIYGILKRFWVVHHCGEWNFELNLLFSRLGAWKEFLLTSLFSNDWMFYQKGFIKGYGYELNPFLIQCLPWSMIKVVFNLLSQSP